MKVRVLLEPPATILRRRRRGFRAVAVVRSLLLLVGLAAISYCAYVYCDAKLYEAYQNWAFDQRTRGLTPSLGDFIWHGPLLHAIFGGADETQRLPPRTDERAEQKKPGHRALPPDALIGRIAIPRLRVRAVVKEGVDDKTLRRGVGHVPGTALPGEYGNIGLAGHRDTFFRGLKDVRRDDVIRLETLDGDYEYSVQSTTIVTPRDVQVLAPSKDAELTLVTCYPFYYVGNAPKRFIVKARQISPKVREADFRRQPGRLTPRELPGS